ncbi:MAG: glycosyltransferase family 2 protein [Deltaproteobacteria bacterium]|nr:glycosyltransferase family 2 protein [Deltaproteobacteria bacterium]
MMENGVSIIIPTLNGGKIFAECLDAIGQQDYAGPIQLIVIDSGSADGTVARAEKAGALVKRIDPKQFHHAWTRNEGVSLAGFDPVVLMVQDAVPCSDQWLGGMVRALKESGAAAAFAAQIPHADATPYARFATESVARARLGAPDVEKVNSLEAFNQLPYDDAYRSAGLDNVCAIYRKEILEKTPFPDVEFAEDLAWAFETTLLGHRILYLPHIQVRHSHNRSPDYDFRRQIINSHWVARIMGRVREDISYLSLQDLMFVTGSARALIFRLMKEKWRGPTECKAERLFVDRMFKQYPLMFRGYRLFSRCLFIPPRLAVKGMAQQVNADIAYQLQLIEDGYPPRDRDEWLRALEQVSANILGRMHGEVYAGCMLNGSLPRPLECFIQPFLSGV